MNINKELLREQIDLMSNIIDLEKDEETADCLVGINQILEELLKEKTERILITVEGGIVQGVNSTFNCDVYVLDLDGDEDYLIAPDGMELLGAHIFDVDCEVDTEIVSHYVKQL